MKHYDELDWKLYKKNLINDDLRSKMEEHLYSCYDCLNTFLDLIDDDEIDAASDIVPKDFTDNIILELNKNKISKIEDRIGEEKKNTPSHTFNKKKFLAQYIAVASVAIVLTATGTFSEIALAMPVVSEKVVEIENKDSLGKRFLDYSDELQESILNKIDDIFKLLDKER